MVARTICVVAFLLAGCSGPAGGPGDATNAPGTPGPDPAGNVTALPVLAYEDCSGIEVVVPVRSQDAQRHMPAGFRPRDIFTDQDATGTLVTQVGQCDGVAVGGTPSDDTSGVHGFAILLAHPPAALQDSSIRIHAIALHLVVGAAQELAPLEAAGLDTGAGGRW